MSIHNPDPKQMDILLDHRIGFYPKEYFLWMLKQELDRIERSNQPLSMLLLRTSFFEDLLKADTNISFNKVIDTFSVMIKKNFRKTDIKGWYDEGILAILMPNTSNPGGFTAYNKFKDKVSESLFQIGITCGKHFDTACDIHTYPDSLFDVNHFPEKGHGSENNSESKEQILSPCIFYQNSYESKGILRLRLFIKRSIDLIGSVIGLICLFPLMSIIGLIIKLTSPGPIFFKQPRLGYQGKPFIFYKFRTMYHGVKDDIHREYVTHLIEGDIEKINKGSAQEPMLKMNDDPRVTPFGRFLRRSSLDELPQLYNVLKGDMSLVGPRPPIPYEVEKYQSWHVKRILEVKPGITGLWQVSGRSITAFDDMVRLDLRYANDWSIGMDIKILFKTVKAVLSAKGAY